MDNSFMRRVWDLHYHIGPEVIPRKYGVAELRERMKGNIKGMALKSHFYPTSVFIDDSDSLIGSVALNNYVGGINKDAVYAASVISKKPIIVWFPTINAKRFVDKSELEIPNEWTQGKIKSRSAKEIEGLSVLNSVGGLSEDAKAVVKAAKVFNNVIATGHLSWQEAKKLAKYCLQDDVTVVITHPIYHLIDMPIEVQKELAVKGAFIEQTYAMYSIDNIPMSKIAEQIKEIGAEKCIMTSDSGQVFSKDPWVCMNEFAEALKKEGISERELELMMITNPEKIISYIK
ncbi:hypothetical protein HN419_04080 [Candidatus Woesearchaeota archaeon]|nr:hypothetical protein [Candidatus Woesearchaeota archaeon]MBT3537943.1 hypothetical protein [Candidatus Woesearchaeota archaeon]MBT4698081.1 hypothetical protein [Candidatus Woesearchaeota archaeon]MBT4717189.1 hypothetical protein [Candidatus Woesearchaeota archaeon]MBT7105612.1 hypothetical protein [Candidatus Woesearchaeota archaeon]